MDKVINALKYLKAPANRNISAPTNERPQYGNNFNKQNRLQNFPYNTQWKDGKPIVLAARGNNSDRGVPNPLQKASINVSEDIPWCVACQSPHSVEHCAVAHSMAAN